MTGKQNDCIFCKIISGEIPCSKVYEDQDIFAFLDISPVNKGHTLVVPKQHCETIIDSNDEMMEKIGVALKKVSAAVKSGTACDGINIVQSNFKPAGQLVPHLHFHIIPRFSHDGLKHWPQGKYEEGEAEKVRKKIEDVLISHNFYK